MYYYKHINKYKKRRYDYAPITSSLCYPVGSHGPLGPSNLRLIKKLIRGVAITRDVPAPNKKKDLISIILL